MEKSPMKAQSPPPEFLPARPLYTAAEMRGWDEATIKKFGIPDIVLMENAGQAVADFLLDEWEADSALILCGKGNNGGDGFVIARRLLADGADLSVWLLGAPNEVRGDALLALKAFLAHGGE